MDVSRYLLICWATFSAFCALLSSLLTNKDDGDDEEVLLFCMGGVRVVNVRSQVVTNF